MPHRHRTLVALALAAAATAAVPAQDLAPGFVDPEPILRAARDAIGTDNLRCVTLSGTDLYTGMVGQAAVPRLRSRLAARRAAHELRPDDGLGSGHADGVVRPRAGAEPGLVALGHGLAGRNAGAVRLAAALLRQRGYRVAPGRRRRRAGGGAPRPGRDLAARHVDQPARVPEGGPASGRQPPRHLALGAGRDGARRRHRAAGEDVHRVDHDVRQVPRGRHHQPAEPAAADPHVGRRAGPGRLQLRARVLERQLRRRRRRRALPHRAGITTRAGTTTTRRRARTPATTRSAAPWRTSA